MSSSNAYHNEVNGCNVERDATSEEELEIGSKAVSTSRSRWRIIRGKVGNSKGKLAEVSPQHYEGIEMRLGGSSSLRQKRIATI